MQISIKNEAKSDLDGIFVYTLEKWGLNQAKKYVRDIHAALSALQIGNAQIKSIPGARHYKRIRVGLHHVIFVETNEGYDIIRILHQSMDTLRHL